MANLMIAGYVTQPLTFEQDDDMIISAEVFKDPMIRHDECINNIYGDCDEHNSNQQEEKESEILYDGTGYQPDRLPQFWNYLGRMYDTLAVVSAMGTFKSTEMRALIKNTSFNTWTTLLITFRVNLGNEYLYQLINVGFKLYSQCKRSEMNPQSTPKLIIVINSLWKVSGQYDLLILDEIRYVMDMMYGFVQVKPKVWNRFNTYLTNSSKVLILDAFLTQFIIDYIWSFRTDKINHIIINWHRPRVEKALLMSLPQLMIDLVNHMTMGGKPVMCTNSNTFLVKTLMPLLNSDFPNRKFLWIYRDPLTNSSINTDVPVRLWGNYDGLFYTPACLAGCSFSLVWFTAYYSYFCNQSCPTSQCSQMIFRVRCIDTDPDMKVIKMAVQMKGYMEYPIDDDDIQASIVRYLQSGEPIGNFNDNDIDIDEREISYNASDGTINLNNAYGRALIQYIKHKNMSTNFFIIRLAFHLKQQGVAIYRVVQEFDAEIKDNTMAKYKKICKEYNVISLQFKLDAYLKEPTPIGIKYDQLRCRNELTPREKRQLVLGTIHVIFNAQLKDLGGFEQQGYILEHLERFQFYRILRENTVDIHDIDMIYLFCYNRYKEECNVVRNNIYICHDSKEKNYWTKYYLIFDLFVQMGFVTLDWYSKDDMKHMDSVDLDEMILDNILIDSNSVRQEAVDFLHDNEQEWLIGFGKSWSKLEIPQIKIENVIKSINTVLLRNLSVTLQRKTHKRLKYFYIEDHVVDTWEKAI